MDRDWKKYGPTLDSRNSRNESMTGWDRASSSCRRMSQSSLAAWGWGFFGERDRERVGVGVGVRDTRVPRDTEGGRPRAAEDRWGVQGDQRRNHKDRMQSHDAYIWLVTLTQKELGSAERLRTVSKERQEQWSQFQSMQRWYNQVHGSVDCTGNITRV